MGPKEPSPTVLTRDEEALIVAFRKHTLLPLDDCLYVLQESIPNVTRSSLHRCLQRNEISRLPELKGEREPKKKFNAYPIGFFHICHQFPAQCSQESEIYRTVHLLPFGA